MPRLLVVDDEPSICWGLKQLGESMGHQVVIASSAEQAIRFAQVERPDVIVLDVRLPGMTGLAAMDHFRQLDADVPVILITAYGDLETAVEAVRNGAFDYLIKPFDLDQAQRSITRALTSVPQAEELAAQRGHVAGLVGRSPAMQEVFKRIALAAHSEACVLLRGESGTGKELAARAVHRYSPRADGPFVAVNMASLSPLLAESELFGHVRGAFTGADAARTGLLTQADGGTLFLDEVADIPLPVQVKLLRVLEHGQITPVGSNETVETNFRVVSATHQDLLARVDEGAFRHDLYFRLCAFQIDIPPLRERVDDIGELVQHFVRTIGDKSAAGISAEALQELRGRTWQGNVRELRNATEHALIVARGGTILPEHFPPPVAQPSSRQTVATDPQDRIVAAIREWAAARIGAADTAGNLHADLLRLVEPPLLAVAMQHHGQCVSAARSLGLHRTTLRRKLDDYGIGEDGT